MTLAEEIAELRQFTPEGDPWDKDDFADGFTGLATVSIAAVLNAVLSGELIPATDARPCPIGITPESHMLCSAGTCDVCTASLRDALAQTKADARLAVALAYQRAADVVSAKCNDILSKQDGKSAAVDQNLRLVAVMLPDLSEAIRALADTDALAEVQKLRDDRDALDKAYHETVAYSEQWIARAEAAGAKLAEWQTSQTYAYIGRDGKTVVARDLEDRAEAEQARGDRLADKLVAAEARADAADEKLNLVMLCLPDDPGDDDVPVVACFAMSLIRAAIGGAA